MIGRSHGLVIDCPDPSSLATFYEELGMVRVQDDGNFDVRVDDLDQADQKVVAAGARRLPGGGERFRVYADPAGHPFCLVSW